MRVSVGEPPYVESDDFRKRHWWIRRRCRVWLLSGRKRTPLRAVANVELDARSIRVITWRISHDRPVLHASGPFCAFRASRPVQRNGAALIAPTHAAGTEGGPPPCYGGSARTRSGRRPG